MPTKKAAHTPGPWIVVIKDVRDGTDEYCRIETADGRKITAIMPDYHPARFADARLIAAAPDLLEAAHGVLVSMVEAGYLCNGTKWDALRAAISKATAAPKEK